MAKPLPPFVLRVLDLLSPLGEPRARAMFGGYGVYLDEKFMAIIVDDVLYLKADDELKPEYLKRGMAPFTFEMRGKPETMPYYDVSEKTLKSGALFEELAKKSYEAAVRFRKKKR